MTTDKVESEKEEDINLCATCCLSEGLCPGVTGEEHYPNCYVH